MVLLKLASIVSLPTSRSPICMSRNTLGLSSLCAALGSMVVESCFWKIKLTLEDVNKRITGLSATGCRLDVRACVVMTLRIVA